MTWLYRGKDELVNLDGFDRISVAGSLGDPQFDRRSGEQWWLVIAEGPRGRIVLYSERSQARAEERIQELGEHLLAPKARYIR